MGKPMGHIFANANLEVLRDFLTGNLKDPVHTDALGPGYGSRLRVGVRYIRTQPRCSSPDFSEST